MPGLAPAQLPEHAGVAANGRCKRAVVVVGQMKLPGGLFEDSGITWEVMNTRVRKNPTSRCMLKKQSRVCYHAYGNRRPLFVSGR